jgi:regulation of enolase protein 1 (concanavalin A-like superfamily)
MDDMTNPLTLPALPAACEWRNPPLDWKVEGDGDLTITAGKQTDWFANPAGGDPASNAPVALFRPPDTHCLLSARVSVEFTAKFDAGVLFVWAGETLWAKLCFEYSPDRQPLVVSVVTRGVSDDCNSVAIDGQSVYLRVARTPQTLAFHYSHDGKLWHFVRYFTLGETADFQAGFSVQSPTGERCQATFSEIRYQAGVLNDNRSGE